MPKFRCSREKVPGLYHVPVPFWCDHCRAAFRAGLGGDTADWKKRRACDGKRSEPLEWGGPGCGAEAAGQEDPTPPSQQQHAVSSAQGTTELQQQVRATGWDQNQTRKRAAPDPDGWQDFCAICGQSGGSHFICCEGGCRKVFHSFCLVNAKDQSASRWKAAKAAGTTWMCADCFEREELQARVRELEATIAAAAIDCDVEAFVALASETLRIDLSENSGNANVNLPSEAAVVSSSPLSSSSDVSLVKATLADSLESVIALELHPVQDMVDKQALIIAQLRRDLRRHQAMRRPAAAAYRGEAGDRQRRRHAAAVVAKADRLVGGDAVKSKELFAEVRRRWGGEYEEIKDLVFRSLLRAVRVLTTDDGRLNDHRRCARQVIFTALAGELQRGHFHTAGRVFGCDKKNFARFSGVLAAIEADPQQRWFEPRAAERSDKTPKLVRERAALHTIASAVPSPCKRLCRNPQDRSQSHTFAYLFNGVHQMRDEFVELEREAQLEAWGKTALETLAAAEASHAVAISTYERCELKADNNFIVVELLTTEPVERRSIVLDELPGLAAYKCRDEDRWVKISFNGANYKAPVVLIRRALTAAQAANIDPPLRKLLRKLCRPFFIGIRQYISCRPYYVRFGSRAACLCVYHLRWDYLCEGLRIYAKALIRAKKVTAADLNWDTTVANERTLRALFVCARVEGTNLDCEDCVELGMVCPNTAWLSRVQASMHVLLLPDEPLASLCAGTAAEDDEGMESDGEDDEDEDDREIMPGGGDNDAMEIEGAAAADHIEWTSQVLLSLPQPLPSHCRLHCYAHRWRKVDVEGSDKKKYKFRRVHGTLKEFWKELVTYAPRFLLHHDLAKDCDRQHKLKNYIQRGEVALGIDAAEGWPHIDIRQIQSEYYGPHVSNIWVLTVRMHLLDIRMDVAERDKLLAIFTNANREPIIRETHFYVTPLKEKGQLIVQHILLDFFQYLAGEGRWAAAATDGSHAYWDDPRVTARERKERAYYEGQGAAAHDTQFKRVFSTSDGAGCQFLCAAFLYFVSRVGRLVGSHMLGFVLVWNWFASAHGKSDCDPEGGAVKAQADEHVNRSQPGVRDNSIRTTLALVAFLRHAEEKRKGNPLGVYRRKVHFVPLIGRGGPNSRTVHKVEPDLRRVRSDGVVGRVQRIRLIRRVVANGFPGSLYASAAPCHECTECVARDFKNCSRSRRSAMFPIELRPASAVDPLALTPSVQADFEALAESGLKSGATLAVETFSEEQSFFLVKPLRIITPRFTRATKTEEHGGVDFVFKKGEPVLECHLYRPRTEHTSWSFVLDSDTKLRIPTKLCRLSIELKKRQSRASRSGGGEAFFDVRVRDRQLLTDRCRLDPAIVAPVPQELPPVLPPP